VRFGFIFPLSQLHWWVGAGVLAAGLIAFALHALEARRRRRLHAFVEAQLAPRLLPGYRDAVRRPLFWLTVVGFAAVGLTFAQPHWGASWQEVRQLSHDVVVCLDTSESMRAANPLPTRLDRAKQKINSLLDKLPVDRFALVAFSGASALQCPLTHDQGYFKMVLDATDTNAVSRKGTDIAAALRECANLFKEETEANGYIDKDSRAILLISDGEQVSGDAVAEAEKVSEYARIYVIGVGDPRGTEVMMPDWMGRYVRVMDGNKPHLSKLDEQTLQRIANAGNGGYILSSPDNSDINEIFAEIQSLAARKTSSDIRLQLVNRYQWPLALAIACFAGEGLWIGLMPLLRSWRLRRLGEAVGVEEPGNG